MNKTTPFRTLESGRGRVRLRRPEAADAGPMALYAADRRVSSMTTSIPHPYLPEMAENFLTAVMAERSATLVWTIDASAWNGSSFVGLISVKSTLREVGYWIGPPFWSAGLATEALDLLLAHLLGACGWDDVRAQVFADNAASQSVLQKCGFVQSGQTTLYSVARNESVPAIQMICTAETRQGHSEERDESQ